MRTTLTIDDDVLIAAKELARGQKRSAGAVISELARQGLLATFPPPAPTNASDGLLGFVPFTDGTDIVVNELIDRLREEEGI